MKARFQLSPSRWTLLLLLALASAVLLYRLMPTPPGDGSDAQPPPSLLPAPSALRVLPGGFNLGPRTPVLWSGEGARQEAGKLAQWLGAYTAGPSTLAPAAPGQEQRGSILLQLSADTSLGAEGYRLYIDEQGVEILAQQPAGLYYATQTLRQLLDAAAGTGNGGPEPASSGKPASSASPASFGKPASSGSLSSPPALRLPALRISDRPAFAWRGVMLDASRHFWTPEQVMRLLDQMAYHKLNVLHWHLTDDQGWRVQVPGLDQLTEVGAWRTQPDGSRYGGWYSPADMRAVVAYAAERHITVVPEIEMPGHSQAALAAYPGLSCTGGPHAVWNDWGVSKEIYCAGSEAVFRFLDRVLDTVSAVFPSPFIHLGGDEAPDSRWSACSRCQARRQELGLADAHALQSWFLRRVADSLALKGRSTIGWDETGEGRLLHPQAVVQAWRGMEHAAAALERGHRVISSPVSHAYFDYDLGSIDLERVFQFHPVPESHRGRPEAALVLGGSANLWSEHIPDQAALDDRLFPRVLAMAEVLWRGPGARSWEAFYADVQAHYPRLERLGVAWGAETVPLHFLARSPAPGQLEWNLRPGAGDASLYVRNGAQAPDSSGTPHGGQWMPLTPGEHTFRARAFRGGRAWGAGLSRRFSLHRATGLTPALAQPWNAPYDGGGAGALCDGRLGTDHFRDGIWQGFWGQDLDATLDLGSPQPVDTVAVGFYQYINSWIFMPRKLVVYGALEPGQWQKLAEVPNPVSPEERNRLVRTFVAVFPARELRYLRVVAANHGPCPPWHEAAGSPAWLFADEIAVR